MTGPRAFPLRLIAAVFADEQYAVKDRFHIEIGASALITGNFFVFSFPLSQFFSHYLSLL